MQMQSVCHQRGGTFETSLDAGFGEVSLVHLPLYNGGKWPLPETGTAPAINYSNSGVAAHSTSSTGRGGARNRADRESHALTVAQIANLKAAERHSRKLGLPFTRMLTIHWEGAGVPLAGMAKATGHLTDLLGKLLKRRGFQAAWLWVHENGDGKGGHCHLLAHVPAELVPTLSRLQLGWLRRITGRPYRARVIHSKPIGGRLGLEAGNPELHAANLESALAYILKGASPEAASQLGLERLEAGGRIIGKRCGTSQNIGTKARQSDGVFAHSARAREFK